MRKFLAALVILCLLAMLVAPVAYATPLGNSNVSSLDIELQQQKEVEQPLPRDEAIKKFNENKAIADQQKREADQKALEQIIQGAKTLPGSAQKSPVPQSKDIGSVTPVARKNMVLLALYKPIKRWLWHRVEGRLLGSFRYHQKRIKGGSIWELLGKSLGMGLLHTLYNRELFCNNLFLCYRSHL
jgi:hypothetical protein